MTDHNIQELRREADDRRDAIVRDVDLVADRVVPGRIADRQKAKVRQSVRASERQRDARQRVRQLRPIPSRRRNRA